jgi:hypothetical protein
LYDQNITYVSYFKTIITTVSLNTEKLSLNTTETQLSHEICMIEILLIMTYVPQSNTFTKAISHKILMYLVIFCDNFFFTMDNQ